MKKLKYSPDAREKLKQIKRYVTQKFGIDTANKVIREMTKSFRDLQQFENKGVSVENVLGNVITECYMFIIIMYFTE